MSLYCKIKNLVLICLVSTCFVGWLGVEGQFGPICPSYVERIIDRINGGGSCEGIKCETGLDKSKCPDGSDLEEGVAFCGCCPGCVKYENKYLAECQPGGPNGVYDSNCNDLICPIIYQCPRGLECRDDVQGLFKCEFSMTPPSARATASTCPNLCLHKKALVEKENSEFKPRRPRDLPSCTKEGTFTPKQCKGEDCFCVDECGKRLFGREFFGRDANMTCGCTTKVHELRSKGLLATLHCKENGDFEKLQCDSDSGLCFCVDEITGKTTGEVLPEMHFRLLPCYNATIEEFAENGRYLRVCESEWVAAKRISQEAALHGGSYSHALPIECDYDGGFAGMFRDTLAAQDRCVHRSGVQILPGFFRTLTHTTPMDCQCARDRVYKARYGVGFWEECEADNADPPPGSYKLYRISEDIAYCLDSDGYQYGPDIPEASVCCLERPLPNENDRKDCTDEAAQCNVNPIPPAVPYEYIPCLDYKMGRTNSY